MDRTTRLLIIILILFVLSEMPQVNLILIIFVLSEIPEIPRNLLANFLQIVSISAPVDILMETPNYISAACQTAIQCKL